MERRTYRHRRLATRPDLPITPMLDMSFQLMAFFLLTFRPAPTEGQLPLALPRDELPGELRTLVHVDDPQKLDSLTVQVYATDTGAVENIVLALPTGNRSIGTDSAALMKFLKDEKKNRGGEAPLLRVEFVDGVHYGSAVKLLDEGRRAGYQRIVPTRITPEM